MVRSALPADTLLLGRYQVDTMLGNGGFGITYVGNDIRLNRLVAIKEYFPKEFASRQGTLTVTAVDDSQEHSFELGRTWFLREARTLAKYRHPNIVGVMDHFEENATAYMVLAFEQGRPLTKWLADLRRPPTQAEIDQINGPILSALETMHDNHDLHRDVAMDNIILRPNGSPVLIDFGSARQAVGQHSRTMEAFVKFGYSPPEQYSSEAQLQGAWSDIYSLAAMWYLAITGRLPPDAPGRLIRDASKQLTQAEFPGYRQGFLDGINWGLRLQPDARPPSIAAWRDKLQSGAAVASSTVTLAKDAVAAPGAEAAATGGGIGAAQRPAGEADQALAQPGGGASGTRFVTSVTGFVGKAPGAVAAWLAAERRAHWIDGGLAGLALVAGAIYLKWGGGTRPSAASLLALALFAFAPAAAIVAGLLRPAVAGSARRAMIANAVPWLLLPFTYVVGALVLVLAFLMGRTPKGWHVPVLIGAGTVYGVIGVLLLTARLEDDSFVLTAAPAALALGLAGIATALRLRGRA